MDIGIYNKDQKLYKNLVEKLYMQYGKGVTLPAEYAYFVHKDLLHFLIRLSRYKFVARLLKKNDRVLEIGSGSGLGSIFLSQYSSQVTGIEVKTTEVQEARSINLRDNVKFIAGDFFRMKNKNDYSVIVALDVIEHMTEKKGKEFILAISKNLDRGGMMVIGTPSCYSYRYQSRLSKASHIKCYDQQELLKVADNYFGRTLAFSMNDEIVHTGFHKLAWYYFILGFSPK